MDVQALAEPFELSGGFIRNAVLTALSEAVAPGGRAPVIRQDDLIEGARLRLRTRLNMDKLDWRVIPARGLEMDTAGRPTSRPPWADVLVRVFQVDVFRCPRCSCRMSRIAWSVDHDVMRRILRAVGLPTDPPVPRPSRSAEDLFFSTRLA